MKYVSYLSGIIFLAISSTVSAIPVLTTGGADNLVDWGVLSNSGEHEEKQFIADYLGVSTLDISFSQLGGSGGEDGAWMQVDEDPDLWAFDFEAANVELFIIRVGNGVGLVSDGTTDTFTHFLYENFNQYGVIDLGIFDRTQGNVEILMVSHVGTVPEPSIVWLLGSGLALIGLVRRRKA